MWATAASSSRVTLLCRRASRCTRARRTASLDQAHAAWTEISRLVELDRLQKELHRAGQALGAEPTEVNSDRVLALHAELSQAEGDESDPL